MNKSSSSNWMSGAVTHPGAFTAKSKAHKLSVPMFASKVMDGKEKADTKTKRQASLAQTFAKLRGDK